MAKASARWPVLLHLLLLAAAAAASASLSPPGPTPARWPERFHAVLFTNLTNYTMASTGPPLRITDLYYDWPRRRNLNLVRHQLAAEPLYDVEWDNGTTFYFDSSSCRTEQFPVGVLRPGWLSDGGGIYLGRRLTGGIECHVWNKGDFIVYFEDVATGRPVRWNFLDATGIEQFVMSFEVGVELEDSQWQAPAHCFPAADGDQGEGAQERRRKSNSEHINGVDDDGLQAAKLLRKLSSQPFLIRQR
ncbi:hypothetical protein ABZP36_000588 [Zizania latifolia]